MDEVQTSAGMGYDADNGTADAGAVTGDSLYEQYENGASIEELNAMLETSGADALESASASGSEAGAANDSHAIAVGEAEQGRTASREQRTADVEDANSEQSPDNGAETQEQPEMTPPPEQPARQERTYTQKDFDRVIGRRVGEEQRKQAALLEDLSALLGVESTQVADTIRRQRLEAEAEAKGVQDKELYARAKQLEQQQVALQEQQAAEQAYRSKIADLQQQGQAIGADILKLSENDAFVSMVNSLYRDPATRGNAVRMAYHAVFFDDAVKAAAQAERDKVISSVKAGQMRVSEGAAGKTAGVAVKLDVGKLSDDQIADMVARAQNGEKITF